jgi:predicted component of type VI protein secretion system
LAEFVWGADASHANALFGRRMIQAAVELFEPRLGDGRQ